MSNIGGTELLAVLLLALLVLGPERLPKAAREIGRFVRKARQMSSGFQDEIRKAVDIDELTGKTAPSRGSKTSGATSASEPRALRPVTAEADAAEMETEVIARNPASPSVTEGAGEEPDQESDPEGNSGSERATG